jgi:hypothetical protein
MGSVHFHTKAAVGIKWLFETVLSGCDGRVVKKALDSKQFWKMLSFIEANIVSVMLLIYRQK